MTRLGVLHRQGFRMFLAAGFFWVKTSTIILTKTMAERGKFRDIDVRTACSMSLQLLRKFEYRGIRHVRSRFQRWSLGKVMTSWVEQSCRGFGILRCFDFCDWWDEGFAQNLLLRNLWGFSAPFFHPVSSFNLPFFLWIRFSKSWRRCDCCSRALL